MNEKPNPSDYPDAQSYSKAYAASLGLPPSLLAAPACSLALQDAANAMIGMTPYRDAAGAE